jgi:hypothetical protein
MLAISSLLATGWISQPLRQRPHRTAAPLRWDEILCGMTQVVTDIDDTIKSSGGVNIGGIALGGVDTSYERNSFYPGVFQFGLELASHTAKPRDPPNKMAVLTARAEEFKWALEIKQSSKLCTRYRQAGEAQGLEAWGVGEVLYGSVLEWVCQERKGWRKFENFKILREGLKPRTRYVFLGDNGKSEKDLEAASRIVDAFPKELQAVFLHAVSGETQPAPLPEDSDYLGVPVVHYRTYATAAVKAFDRRLLDAAAARRVVEAVEADMALDSVNLAPGSANAVLLQEEISAAYDALDGKRGLGRRLKNSLKSVWRKTPSLESPVPKKDEGGAAKSGSA